MTLRGATIAAQQTVIVSEQGVERSRSGAASPILLCRSRPIESISSNLDCPETGQFTERCVLCALCVFSGKKNFGSRSRRFDLPALIRVYPRNQW